MHGMIFYLMRRYVVNKLGPDAWNNLLTGAGMPGKLFLGIDHYPDEEIVALVTTASKATGVPVPALLEDFGEFLAPQLATTYSFLTDSKWTMFDFLENTERSIHEKMRKHIKGNNPPVITCTRKGPDKLLLTYSSPRKLCLVARGVIKGAARHFKQLIDLEEPRCMLNGAAACTFSIALAR